MYILEYVSMKNICTLLSLKRNLISYQHCTKHFSEHGIRQFLIVLSMQKFKHVHGERIVTPSGERLLSDHRNGNHSTSN